MKKYKPSVEIISRTQKWLGKEGISFFTKVHKEHGTLNCCLEPDVISGITCPHPVHFREGMQVRNFLRTLEETECWDAHDFDNRWELIVKKAIGV